MDQGAVGAAGAGARCRIFVAIELGDEARRLANETIAWLQPRVPRDVRLRFVEPADLHVTLAFLGELGAAELASVCALVGHVAAEHPACTAEMGGLGAFPRTSAARVIWLAFGRGHAPLAACVSDLETRLRAAGFALEDREWTGHVTLARSIGRWGFDACALFEDAPGHRVTHRVESLSVMESRPAPTIPRYATKFRADLSK